jgi:hypothetical protein
METLHTILLSSLKRLKSCYVFSFHPHLYECLTVKGKVRWSYPCNRPWRPVRLWDVETPTFCLDDRFTDGGKVACLKQNGQIKPSKKILFSVDFETWQVNPFSKPTFQQIKYCLLKLKFSQRWLWRIPLWRHVSLARVSSDSGTVIQRPLFDGEWRH